jgi:hypothetical protein
MTTIRKDAPQKIDRYIAKLPDFSREICTRLRELIHKADERIVEDWKWGPNFNKDGMICGFGAFKEHVSFAFFKGAVMSARHKLFNYGFDNASNRSVKFTSADEIDEEKLMEYIREAVELNEKGIEPEPPKRDLIIPKILTDTLEKHPEALKTFEGFPYSHKKEYVEWFTEAKREETKERRLKKMVEMLKEGKGLNDKYR